MTDKIAIGIGIILFGLLGLDYAINDSASTMFLARKFYDLTEWVAFWR